MRANLYFTKHTRTNLTFFQDLVQLFQWRNPYNSIALSVAPINRLNVGNYVEHKAKFHNFKKKKIVIQIITAHICIKHKKNIQIGIVSLIIGP